MNLFSRLQQWLDIRRLERRYTRRAHRSTKWTETAIYVDGEYVYASSSSSTSPTQSSPPPPSSTVSPSWTSGFAALAGYCYDPVAAGARLDGKGLGNGEGDVVEMRTWRGKGQKTKGKATGVGEREGGGEGARKRRPKGRREGVKGKPSSATAAATASLSYTSTLASLAGYCYDPVAAGAYVDERGEHRRVAHAEGEGNADTPRMWRGRGERGKRNGKGKRARIRIWVRQVFGR